MGLFASYDLCLPKPLLHFLWLLNRMSHIFSLFLVFLRLHPPPPSQAIRIHPSFHTTDQHLSSPAPAPLPIVPTLIKSMLPVIRFARLAGDSPSATACVVCLEGLTPGDEVRELGNCRHAFHTACIDNWIDMDGISCPLCRLPLLPLKEEDEKKGVLVKFFTRISWTLQIN